MTEFPRITRDPEVMSGRACLRDSHVTASTVVALMATGRSHEEIIRMFPVLTPDDLQEALAYAAWWIDEQDTPRAIPEIDSQPTSFSNPPSVEPSSAPDAGAGSIPGATPEQPLEPEEALELFHPSCPDQATVAITRHGLFDRRWRTHTIAWADIREIRRTSGRKTIDIVLRNPDFYVASMPFFKRIPAQIKEVFNLLTLHLDTASLGIRTKDLYLTACRLWVKHRGKERFRKKRRVRVREKFHRSVDNAG